MSDITSKRSRKWSLTVHENDKALQLLEPMAKTEPTIKNGFKIAYIMHDKDLNEDGSTKLKHWHVIIEYQNARTWQSIKNTFEGAHVEIPANYDATIQYLIHKNDLNKHQYKVDEIITNDLEWLKGHINADLRKSMEQQEIELIQNILNDKYESFFDLIVSYDFDMTFLQRRKGIIEELFKGVAIQKRNATLKQASKIIEATHGIIEGNFTYNDLTKDQSDTRSGDS